MHFVRYIVIGASDYEILLQKIFILVWSTLLKNLITSLNLLCKKLKEKICRGKKDLKILKLNAAQKIPLSVKRLT